MSAGCDRATVNRGLPLLAFRRPSWSRLGPALAGLFRAPRAEPRTLAGGLTAGLGHGLFQPPRVPRVLCNRRCGLALVSGRAVFRRDRPGMARHDGTPLAPLPGGAFVWAPSPLRRMPCADSASGRVPDKPGGAGNALGESRWGLAGLCSPVLTKWLRLRPPGLRAGAPRLPAHAVGSGAVSQPTSATRPTPLGTGAGPCGEIFAVRGPPLDSPPMTQASPAGALTVRGSERRNYEW